MAKVYCTSLTLLVGIVINLTTCSWMAMPKAQAQDGRHPQDAAGVGVTASDPAARPDLIPLLRQATLADPGLRQTVQEHRQQFAVDAHLEVGAVAAVAYYGLAEWFVVGGDLVNGGNALLIYQDNRWSVVAPHTGDDFSSSQASTLLRLGVPEEIIPPLLEAFRAAGAEGEDGASLGEGNALPTPQAELPYLALEEIVIGGISLDMDEAAIRQQLGEPVSIRDEETGCCGRLRHLEYPTLAIGFVEGVEPGEMVIYSLETTSPDVSTAAGVRVGDTRQALVAAYGQPHDQGMEGDRCFLTYMVEYDSSRLGFELENGKIIRISYYSLLN